MAQQIATNDTLAPSSGSLDRQRPKRAAMKTVKQGIVLSFLATLLWHVSPCQAGAGGVTSAVSNATETPSDGAVALNSSELDDLIARMVREKHLVGLSVGVMRGSKVVLAKGYGVRSLTTNDPVTPETLFAIGSITKQFTCAALLLLVQEGKLSLDDHVAKYDARLTRAADITLLDLGQHVSGYHDYYPLDFVDRPMSQPRAADQIIRDY